MSQHLSQLCCQWRITPLNTPSVLRKCSKCNHETKFFATNDFRINANGRSLDIWLIYKCEFCNTTWNMDILTRVKPQSIHKTLYHKFLCNDSQTAFEYAFNKQILSANKAVVCYQDIQYRVEKIVSETKESELEGYNEIEILYPYDLNLRLDRVLSETLGISRSKIKGFYESKAIQLCSEKSFSKIKLSNHLKIYFKEDFINANEK